MPRMSYFIDQNAPLLFSSFSSLLLFSTGWQVQLQQPIHRTKHTSGIIPLSSHSWTQQALSSNIINNQGLAAHSRAQNNGWNTLSASGTVAQEQQRCYIAHSLWYRQYIMNNKHLRGEEISAVQTITSKSLADSPHHYETLQVSILFAWF